MIGQIRGGGQTLCSAGEVMPVSKVSNRSCGIAALSLSPLCEFTVVPLVCLCQRAVARQR